MPLVLRTAPETLAFGQGLYYTATGIWPLFSIGTFQKVTGPKRDLWLVKTVGVLVTAVGSIMLFSWSKKKVPAETRFLAVGNALALAGVDIYCALKGTISKIYLLDAVLELGIVLAWARTGAPRMGARWRTGRAGSSPQCVASCSCTGSCFFR